MNKTLVIGDCHVDEEQDLSRFELLGEFVIDNKPEHIVIIGDFLTLNCLSAWDRDKRQRMENRRYEAEIGAGNLALDMMLEPMRLYNKRRRMLKMAQYKPNIVYIEGNHEERLKRYFEYDPTFAGHVSIEKDLKLAERGIEWVDYRNYYHINNVAFTHIPHNKVQPISGMDITRKAQNVTVQSCVFGHTHEQHLSHVHKQGMPHLQDTYNCGCFISKKEDYVQGRVTNYWRGITLLHMWKEGRFDVEMFSLGRLERMYE